jgi:hypothetical protein
MLDENLIPTLEQSLRQTRNAQNRLMGRLREAEAEVELLRLEIGALENSAAQTELAIDSLLVTMRPGARTSSFGPSSTHAERQSQQQPLPTFEDRDPRRGDFAASNLRRSSSVAYFNQGRGIPSISSDLEPLSNRFSDRTITQACTLLLRESGGPLHVNELYNLLVSGGMKFKGNNPTISIAVSLNRNSRFRKVDPGTFDLVIREAIQAAS